MKKNTSKKIQFDFSSGALNQLNKLVTDTNAASKAEVIRSALRLYEYTISMLRDEYELIFRKGEELKAVELLVNYKNHAPNESLTEKAC